MMIRELHPMAESKQERMERVRQEVKSCRRCGLCEGARNPVVGEGNLDSNVVFIGEAPGRREDETGRPFVGAAGKLLDQLLKAIGLRREDVYIGNVVKCRPPDNRRPKPSEMEACTPHLVEQLDIIRPRVIVAMGNSAIAYFWSKFGLKTASMGELHGKDFEVNMPWGRVVLFACYHPAAALYNVELERVLEKDFQALADILRRVG